MQFLKVLKCFSGLATPRAQGHGTGEGWYLLTSMGSHGCRHFGPLKFSRTVRHGKWSAVHSFEASQSERDFVYLATTGPHPMEYGRRLKC